MHKNLDLALKYSVAIAAVYDHYRWRALLASGKVKAQASTPSRNGRSASDRAMRCARSTTGCGDWLACHGSNLRRDALFQNTARLLCGSWAKMREANCECPNRAKSMIRLGFRAAADLPEALDSGHFSWPRGVPAAGPGADSRRSAG
ncbi:TPA: hypothetical protein SMW43_001387 [Pseudomonas aeruginosa]|nr:hypothetical protein [Pseudomonas aeruginosa]